MIAAIHQHDWHALLGQVDRKAQPDWARANDDYRVTGGGGTVLVFRPPIGEDSLLIAHWLRQYSSVAHISLSRSAVQMRGSG